MTIGNIDLTALWQLVAEQLTYHAQSPIMFTSGLFWVLMLLFLPLYALLKSRRTQMMVFVAAFSLYFFYKCSGWFCLLLVATSLVDWWLARLIARSESRKWQRCWLVVSLVCSLGILAFFKYSNFFLWNLADFVGANFQPLDLILPVGISFYTFRTISYVVDVYKGKMQPVESWLDYLFFLSFFPCLVAGPIVRARDFMPQLQANKPATRAMIYGGLWLVLVGVFKKAVVADYLAQYVDIAFGNPTGYTGVELLMAMLGYTMQIYCDFSGYSDMAIGIGAILGFDLGLNFDLPYRSLNVTEFWRRWHISLSFWLRDYLYIPLGGNRKGKWRQHLNLMITMLLGGLWHGAAWTYVAWGAGHGVALCVHKLLMPSLNKVPNNAAVKFVSWLLTFTVVAVLWVFFRAENFEQGWQVIAGVFTRFDPAYLPVFCQVRFTWCVMLVAIFALHFVPRSWIDRAKAWFIDSWWVVKLLLVLLVIQLVLQFSSADVQPFLYARF